MSTTRPQPIAIPSSKSSSQSQGVPMSPTSSTAGSVADSFPLISPSVEGGWVGGFLDFLSKNTGYAAAPSSQVKSGKHEAKRHGAMGMFD
ncbi:hypothetical protein FRB98_001868 [Tulasnella sp. 332]|nr:hypothetical protein FRB98_001868 [Tulasnella sp. 332]